MLSNKLIYRIFLSRKCLANIWYIIAVPVLLVCDDCVFVKILKETSELLGEDCEQEIPYDGKIALRTGY